jgi:hypothetical protein
LYTWFARFVLNLDVKGFIIDATQTGTNFTRFARHIVRPKDEQLREWLNYTMLRIREVELYHETGVWPQNFSACDMYGRCQFKDSCEQPTSMRQHWLEADFIAEPHPHLQETA